MTRIPLQPGQALPPAELAISQELIDRYAVISGDFNPVHVDVEGAAKSPFGGTIAHGCLPVEPMFQALARALGRPDLPYGTRVSLRYRAPSRPGDTIHIEGEVAGCEDGHWRIPFACVNAEGVAVLDGEVRVPDDETPGGTP